MQFDTKKENISFESYNTVTCYYDACRLKSLILCLEHEKCTEFITIDPIIARLAGEARNIAGQPNASS